MKRFLRYLSVIATMLMVVVGDVWGQTYNGGTWYSLYDTGENSNVNAASPDFAEKSVFAPADSMTFEYKKYSLLSMDGMVEVYNKVNGTDWSSSKGSVSYSDRKNWKTSPTISLDANISHIRYKMASGTGVYVRNHFVKLKKHILLESGVFGASSVTVTDGNLATAEGYTSTNAYKIKLRSFLASGNIKMTSSNSEFHFGGGVTEIYLGVANNYCASANGSGNCSATTLGKIDNYFKDVYFSPSVKYTKDARSTTITITDGVNTAYVYLTAPVIPTYYFKAEAIAHLSTGGTATANFEGTGNNTYSLVASGVNASSASANVTFTASAANAGYVYEGWKKNSTDVSFYKQGAGTESFVETVTSSALNPNGLASQLTYYAIYSQRYTATITGSNYANKKVGEPFTADYNFINTQTARPSSLSTDPFYYVISHDFSGNDSRDDSPNPSEVIAYDATTNTITPLNEGRATITFYQKNTSTHDSVSKSFVVDVIKHQPIFTWHGQLYNVSTTEYFNSQYADFFVSSSSINNASINLTYASSDEDVAVVSAGSNTQKLNLTTYNKEASTTLTVTQSENYYWYEKTETKVVTPVDPNNHVTFTITSANHTIFGKTFSSNAQWSGSGYLLGDGGWTAQEDYVIVQFTGVPDRLYFDKTLSTSLGQLPGTYLCRVYESVNGTDWGEHIWESNVREEHTNDNVVPLSPTTRYIKFSYNGTVNCTYKNITVTELREFHAVDVNNDKIEVDTLYFGQQYVDNPSVTKKFDLKYANAGYKVALESTDPQFTVSPTFIDTIGGEKFGKVKNIQVVYNPDKEHNTNATNAKIRLYDECGYKDSIILVANTIKSTPTLRWADKWSATKPVLILNQEVTDAAISNNGYSQIKYRSSNPSAIEIINDGTAFRAISVGDSAVITAYQEADQVYNAPADISKTFKVTDKMMQYIVWNDDLTRLYVDSEPVALTAQVWVMTDAETGTWEYSAEQTAKLKYHSSNTSVVSVSNDTLYVQGIGELMLDAYVEADAIYEEVHTQIPVRVRDHSATCTEEDLIIPLVGMNLSKELQYDPYAIYDNEKIVEIDRSKGIPGSLHFSYRGAKAWGQLSGKIRVFESVDGGSSWSQVLSDAEAVTPTTTTQYSPMIPISRNATHLKFERYDQVKMGYHMIGYITIYPAKFIEAEDIDFGNVYVGNTVSVSKTFSYSSVRGLIDITTSNSHLSTTPKSISKECGAWGSESLTITLNADASVIGEFKQYVEIHDAIGNIMDTIKVSANIVKNSPTITWEPTIDTIRSSADWALQKTALSSAGDEVQYDIVSGDNLYAKLDSYGKMILLHGGVITARAFTPESDRSNEVEQTRQFVIIVDPLFENTANDNDWHNPNNWNIGREPYANDSATILTNQSARITKHVQLVGLKFQLGCGLHVDSLGGLTVGDQGIQGAENDSIVLYNTLQGVGFLRVAPAAKFKPQRVKVFYTTGAYDSGIPRDEKWQYIGAPGSNMQMEDTNLTTIYHWNEQQGWIKLPDAGLVPFSGYAFTQKKAEKATFAISANPILSNQEITLTCTPSGMGGSNVFANSFLAPIDLTAFDDADFEGNVDKAFYLFNSGSWNQWQQQGGSTNTMVHGISPGQYYALSPYGSSFMDPAYDQTTIPPMQGVYVVAREDGAKIKLDYTKHVYNANASNQAMRAPQRHKEDFKRVRLQVNSANSGADRMYVVQYDECTPGYDNGYDAKNMPAEGQVSIYSHEKEGQMEISVTNRIDSTYIGFRAGTDTEYTIHMTSVRGEELYLKDLQDNVLMPIVDGAAYTFSATPKSVNDRRFLLIDKRYESVGGDSDQVDVYVYDRKVYIKQAPAGSKMYIYTIGGLSIASYPIGDTPCIVDLSMLPTGIYLLKINNQAYKFVCK